MREIHVDDIVAILRQLCIDANIEIRPDTVAAYHRALEQEESETGREVLRQLILNAEAAKAQRIPFCRIPVMLLFSLSLDKVYTSPAVLSLTL
jgi:fumarate hydratase subunit alpha